MKRIITLAILLTVLSSCQKSEKEKQLEKFELLERRLKYMDHLASTKDIYQTRLMVKELDSSIAVQDSLIEVEMHNLNLKDE